MAKITKVLLKIQKFTKKLPQNQKNYLKLQNDQKITYLIYIFITSSSSPGFIYLRESHRIQGNKDDIIKIQALVIN
jgi:hypothetical protein